MPRKVEWKPKKSRISQIYSDGLEYAFVSKDYKQINQFVYCKDFMQDAIQGYLNGVRADIYSFVYDPSTCLPLHMDSTRLILSNWRDKQFKAKVPNCLDFINQIEEKLKMKKTTMEDCFNPPPVYKKAGIWLVEGSKRWMKAPPMISLYTLLLRVGFSHKAGEDFMKTLDGVQDGTIPAYQKHDRSFVQDARKSINWILDKGDRRLFHSNIRKNYLKEIGIYEMHNSCGIIGYARCETQHRFPYWYRLVGKGAK